MLDVSNSRNKPIRRSWHKPALKLALKHLPKRKAKTLDFGCGLCEFSTMLKKKGYNVSGVDGSSNYVKRAKKLGFDAKLADFNNKVPFKDKSFDLVTSLEVIEHVEKAELMLSEINRILKQSGYLVISTPNYGYWGIRLHMLFGRKMQDQAYHFRFFNHKTLPKLLQKQGFRFIEDANIAFSPWYRISKRFKAKSYKVKCLKNLLSSKLIYIVQKK